MYWFIAKFDSTWPVFGAEPFGVGWVFRLVMLVPSDITWSLLEFDEALSFLVGILVGDSRAADLTYRWFHVFSMITSPYKSLHEAAREEIGIDVAVGEIGIDR